MTDDARLRPDDQQQSLAPLPPDVPDLGVDTVPLMRSVPEPTPFPVEALGPLRAAAEALHDMTQAPIGICGQSVLAVTAFAAQALYDVETMRGPAPLSLFFLTVAQSGERKSTCDRIAMEAVWAFEEELRASREAELAACRTDREIRNVDYKRILRSKDDQATRAAALEALGPEPQEPLFPYVIAAEPTLEGITKNMPQLRASLGIFSDEGGSFLGGYSMSRAKRPSTLSGLSSMWDGKLASRWRAGSLGSFRGRRLTMHLMVQPAITEELLSGHLPTEQGFLARFLISNPSSAIGQRTRRGHSCESERILEAFHKRIHDLLRQVMPLRAGTRNELDPPALALTGEARDALEAFAIEIEEAQAQGGALEDIRPFASKAAEHAARLAGVLSVFSGDESVGGGLMASAIRLTRYYTTEATRLSCAARVSKATSSAERTRVWLCDRWTEDHISIADAAQRSPVREAKALMSDFALLERLGHLVPVEGGATILGKHRRKAWYVVRGTHEPGHKVTQAPLAPGTPEHDGTREIATRGHADDVLGGPAANVAAGAAPSGATAEGPRGDGDGCPDAPEPAAPQGRHHDEPEHRAMYDFREPVWTE